MHAWQGQSNAPEHSVIPWQATGTMIREMGMQEVAQGRQPPAAPALPVPASDGPSLPPAPVASQPPPLPPPDASTAPAAAERTVESL